MNMLEITGVMVFASLVDLIKCQLCLPSKYQHVMNIILFTKSTILSDKGLKSGH